VGTHLSQALAGVGIPDADHLIVTGRCDVPAILGELRTSQTLGVSCELANVLSGLNVPQLDAEISRAGHNGVAPHLYRVDGAVVTSKLLDQVTSVAVPDANGKVLAASHDMLVVESEIENGCCVMSKSADRLVSGANIVNDAGRVRGSGYENIIVVLQAQNRRHVMGRERSNCRHGEVRLFIFRRTRSEMSGLVIFIVKHIGLVDNLVRSDDKTALKGMHIPDTNSLVAGTSDDFVPIQVRKWIKR
jgi:hypothetical protein